MWRRQMKKNVVRMYVYFFSSPFDEWIQIVHAMACGYVRVQYSTKKCNRIIRNTACCVPVQIPCKIVYASRPVKSRTISIPPRAIPWYLNRVPRNPLVSHSRPVQSLHISIPSKLSRSIPWWFNPVLYRPVLKIPFLIPSRGILGYLDPAGSRPETKVRSRGKPW